MTRHLRCVVLLAFGCLALPALADAPKPAEKSGTFLRLRRDARGKAVALETAIARYTPASGEEGLTVDLVGVIHVADKGYYRLLNKELDSYDVVLYELVAPPGTRIPKGGRKTTDNPIAMLQKLMTTVLDLASQVEEIDYTRPRLVHADLSPDQMAARMRARGQDGLTLVLNIAADLIRNQNVQALHKPAGGADDDFDPLALLFDADSAGKLKRLMAEQMLVLEAPGGGLGQTLTTMLIADRNEAAVKVLRKQIAGGKKKIAIFYGAAHMPDFERRLREGFGLVRSGQRWLTAWDLSPKKDPVNSLLKLLDQ